MFLLVAMFVVIIRYAAGALSIGGRFPQRNDTGETPAFSEEIPKG